MWPHILSSLHSSLFAEPIIIIRIIPTILTGSLLHLVVRFFYVTFFGLPGVKIGGRQEMKCYYL